MTTWWRRNRVALALLPLAAVAAIAGSSSRIQEYWYDRGFHDPQRPDDRGVARVVDAYDDGYLRYPIEAEVSLRSVRTVTSLPGSHGPVELPDDAVLWQVGLHVEADPSVALTGCSVALVGTDGSRHLAGTGDVDTNAPTPVHACVPDEAPGPQARVGSTDAPAVRPGEPPRPPAYDTVAYVVTPDDVVPDAVRVWWFLPTYADLPVEAADAPG